MCSLLAEKKPEADCSAAGGLPTVALQSTFSLPLSQIRMPLFANPELHCEPDGKLNIFNRDVTETVAKNL